MNKLLNKRSGIIAGMASVVVIGAIIVTTTFSSAMTLDEAKDIAKKHVPNTATFLTSEDEQNKYEVYFHDNQTKQSYEVEINKDTKEVRKVESQLDNDRGSKVVKLSEAEIQAIVLAKYPGLTAQTINLNMEDGLYEYEVIFQAKDFFGTIDINPETGAILESGIKYGTAVEIPEADGKFITSKQAQEAALKLLGGGMIKDLDVEKENGSYVYELEILKDGVEYELIVDAKTGKVTEEGKHDSHLNTQGTTGATPDVGSSQAKVSLEQARNIVLAKVAGAKIVDLKLEMDDGKLVYEGEATKGDTEYDFEIDAVTGKILDWDSEAIDQDKDEDEDDDEDKDDDNDKDDDDDNDKDDDDDNDKDDDDNDKDDDDDNNINDDKDDDDDDDDKDDDDDDDDDKDDDNDDDDDDDEKDND